MITIYNLTDFGYSYDDDYNTNAQPYRCYYISDECRCCRSKLEHCEFHYKHIQQKRQNLQNDWRCKELPQRIKELKCIEAENETERISILKNMNT